MQQQCRGGKQLGRGTGLERIGKGRGTDGGDARPAPLPGRQSQQLAVGGIEEDDIAPLRPHLRQRVVQSALGDLLQLRVQRQNHIVPRNRLADQPSGRVVAPAGAILEEHRLPRLAGENRVERELEARRPHRRFG